MRHHFNISLIGIEIFCLCLFRHTTLVTSFFLASRKVEPIIISIRQNKLSRLETYNPCKSLTTRRQAYYDYSSTTCVKQSKHNIDYQNDDLQFGRGDMHLSAILDERDVVVYQTGTWEVDGVQVGDGNPAKFEYCVIETMQVVWTHNCEHGYIRGLAVDVNNERSEVKVISPLVFIEFGPEQLVARLPVSWISEEEATLLVNIPDHLLV